MLLVWVSMSSQKRAKSAYILSNIASISLLVVVPLQATGFVAAVVGVAMGVAIPAVLGPREDGEGIIACILSMEASILLNQSLVVVPPLATSVGAAMAVGVVMVIGVVMGVAAVSGPL